MNSKKLRLILLGLLGFSAILFVMICFLGLSILSKKSHKLVELKAQSKSVDAEVSTLTRAKKDVETYKYFNDVAKTVIPKDKDQAQAVADIFKIANDNDIMLQTLSFPSSTLGEKPTAVAPSAPASGSASTPSPTATPAPAASATKNLISQAKPDTGITGLYGIDVTLSPITNGIPDSKKVTYPKLLAFLAAIEHNRRTAQVTQVSIQPIAGSDSNPSQYLNFGITLTVFIKP